MIVFSESEIRKIIRGQILKEFLGDLLGQSGLGITGTADPSKKADDLAPAVQDLMGSFSDLGDTLGAGGGEEGPTDETGKAIEKEEDIPEPAETGASLQSATMTHLMAKLKEKGYLGKEGGPSDAEVAEVVREMQSELEEMSKNIKV